MNSDIQTFENSEFGSIRIVEIENEPYFVGKDVADVLGYNESNKAISRHIDEEDRMKHPIPSTGGIQSSWVINESGLYSLILSSKLPTAKKFKRWVTSEVLPSIRKHGAYMTSATIEQAILNPDTIIKLATALKEEQSKNKQLQAVNSELAVNNQIMKPKADYFDELVDRNLLTNLRETAKQLEIKQKDFINFLLEKKYLYRDKRGKLMPYAKKNNGLFEVKEVYNDKTKWCGTQTLVTPKGRETFRLLYLKTA
ncbi:BRO family protein [Ruminococcoides sp. CLA-AA-H171]|jgi:prophage antirepressor-like protein|uniref:BRO family protein n=1 Tax=Ruminococcoides intestinihominis TaxID=3133161 RepID=A0ABV1HTX8_9FIRM